MKTFLECVKEAASVRRLKDDVTRFYFELPHELIKALEDAADLYATQSNSHKHSVMQTLPLAFVKWYSGMEEEKILKAYERWGKESGIVAVASEGLEKSMSAGVHDCTKYAKINCKCEGYCEYEERLAGRLPRQQLF